MKSYRILPFLFVLLVLVLASFIIPQKYFSPLKTNELNLVQPYEDKLLLATSSFPAKFNYVWYLNGTEITKGTTNTIFLAHFDGNLITTEGESPISNDSISFESAKFSTGVKGTVTYNTSGNLNLTEGTIEFWLTLKEQLNSSVYDENPYIFEHNNFSASEYFSFKVNSGDNLYFTVFNGSWLDSIQIGTNSHEIPPNKPIFIAITYSLKDNHSALYLNGYKIGSRKYDMKLSYLDEFKVGNPYVILDEFRIFDRKLSPKEVMYDYIRGTPFSNNDIYLDFPINGGDEVMISSDFGLDKQQIKNPKIRIISPQGYFIKNTNNLKIIFETDLPADCKYDDSPAQYESLKYMVPSDNRLLHILEYPTTNTISFKEIYIKCSGDDNDDYALHMRYRINPPTNNRYPKLASFYWGNALDPSNETQIKLVSRYDMVGLAMSNMAYPSTFDKLRQYNPDIIITSYSNSISTNKNVIGYYNEEFIDKLNTSLRLQNSDGDLAVNPSFPNSVTYNVYDERFTDLLSDHLKDVSSYGLWDGFFMDVSGDSFWFLRNYSLPGAPYIIYPDIDMDGHDENLSDPVELEIAKAYWREGISRLFEFMREKAGEELFIIPNGVNFYPSILNGKVWEGKLEHSQAGSDNGPVSTFLEYNDTLPMMDRSFPYWMNATKEPHLGWNLFTNEYDPAISTKEHYKRHRLGLAASIIGGVYYDVEPAPEGYDKYYEWYDEYWVDPITAKPTNNDTIGSGYLGEPISEIIRDGDIWERKFENGIAILNGYTEPKNITLDYIYRRINGTQDPIINNGSLTGYNLTLEGKDGIILLRALCTNNPSDDPNCISICGNNICELNENCNTCSDDCGTCPSSNNPGGPSNSEDIIETDTDSPSSNSYCGDNYCDASESCISCSIDCGNCTSIDYPIINLDDIPIISTIITQGQYNLIVSNKIYIMSFFGFDGDSNKFIIDGKNYELNYEESKDITLGQNLIKISYAENLPNAVKLTFSLGNFMQTLPYSTNKPIYIFIFAVIYLIIFIYFSKKTTSKPSQSLNTKDKGQVLQSPH